SEQSENTGNLNYAIKDALYDEDTIDQKLIDFVNNVNFSLDYTENDYDTDKDGKKGEIKINNINIGYKNSKNIFEASNLDTKEAISNAINNDSGVTARFSNNLYKKIKSNYLSVGFTLDILKVYTNKIVDDTEEDNDNLQIKIYVTLGVFAVANTAATVLLFFYLFRPHGESSKNKKALFILIAIVGLIVMGIANGLLICNELNINSDKIEKIENLKKQWDTPVEGSDKFFQKISDDQKYFWSNSEETAEKCQEEFNNLSISEVKEKKSFYEQCLIKPDDYDTEPEKYADTPYGMFKNSMKKFDEVNNILVDVSWRFTTVIIIDCIVFISICSCLIFAIRSYNKNFAASERERLAGEAGIYAGVATNGLHHEGLIKKNEYIDGEGLERAIAEKNIIFREADDFNNIPRFNPEEYGKTMEGRTLIGKLYYFRIKLSFYNLLNTLVKTF
ncbi:MAG: hypothetical protein IJK72_01285, partial [Mycoplasma sp.]|nr:hypothetical protein [Mycoplasma sp.]